MVSTLTSCMGGKGVVGGSSECYHMQPGYQGWRWQEGRIAYF
jgi:hypothetical protein